MRYKLKKKKPAPKPLKNVMCMVCYKKIAVIDGLCHDCWLGGMLSH